MSNPSLSPSSLHLAFEARSWGAPHLPPVQVLNCLPPTHRRWPSVHALPRDEAAPDGPAVDAVVLVWMKFEHESRVLLGGGETPTTQGWDKQGAYVLRRPDGEMVEVVAPYAPDADAVPADPPPVADDDAVPLEAKPPFRGFPSHGCLKRLAVPSG